MTYGYQIIIYHYLTSALMHAYCLSSATLLVKLCEMNSRIGDLILLAGSAL